MYMRYLFSTTIIDVVYTRMYAVYVPQAEYGGGNI